MLREGTMRRLALFILKDGSLPPEHGFVCSAQLSGELGGFKPQHDGVRIIDWVQTNHLQFQDLEPRVPVIYLPERLKEQVRFVDSAFSPERYLCSRKRLLVFRVQLEDAPIPCRGIGVGLNAYRKIHASLKHGPIARELSEQAVKPSTSCFDVARSRFQLSLPNAILDCARVVGDQSLKIKLRLLQVPIVAELVTQRYEPLRKPPSCCAKLGRSSSSLTKTLCPLDFRRRPPRHVWSLPLAFSVPVRGERRLRMSVPPKLGGAPGIPETIGSTVCACQSFEGQLGAVADNFLVQRGFCLPSIPKLRAQEAALERDGVMVSPLFLRVL